LEESPVKQKKNFEKTASWKKIIIITTAIILTIFIWFYNIKPLIINAPINIAEYFTGVKQCNEAFNQMEKILPSHSFLDSYVRMEYVGFIKKCASYTTENDLIYAKKGVELLKEAVKIQPAYTRYWIFLGSFTNVLIDKEQNSEQKQKLVEEANYYFEKTSQLSPNRQEIYIEWAKTDMIVKNYQGIKEKSEKCIELNPNFGDCYWMLWLSDLYLKDYKNAEKDLNMALEKGFEINSMFALNQLANVYAQLKDYQNLSLTYEKLIRQFPNAAEYHASLAFTYAQMGRYEDARKQALLFLEMMPEAESEVDAFLKTLPY
jgi:tetratricopeptide (TPR) repeat protein